MYSLNSRMKSDVEYCGEDLHSLNILNASRGVRASNLVKQFIPFATNSKPLSGANLLNMNKKIRITQSFRKVDQLLNSKLCHHCHYEMYTHSNDEMT